MTLPATPGPVVAGSVISPIAVVQAIVRNIVPLVGILVFHWSAGNVLLLYLLDTVLSMAVIMAGLASSFAPKTGDGIGTQIQSQATFAFVGLFLAALFSIPLGMPVGMMLASSGFSFRQAFTDPSLRNGALIQAAIALWSYASLYRALRTHTPMQLHLRPRFALVFMRWIVVIMVTYFIMEILPASEWMLLLLVVAYIGSSIAAEIAPDRFLLAMPGGADNLIEDASTLNAPKHRDASNKTDRRNQ